VLIADCQLPILRKLEIGNRKLAMYLPARLNYARDLTLQRQLAKTDATEVELSQVTSRPPASFASSVGAHRKLRLASRFCYQ
jgi:hypothetical protein